jgi:hypothetical protein
MMTTATPESTGVPRLYGSVGDVIPSVFAFQVESMGWHAGLSQNAPPCCQ